MLMTTKIQKWGNSLAVRIPKKIVHNLSLKAGSNVVVREDENGIVIHHAAAHRPSIRKDAWNMYIIPTKHKKENVSKTIDMILYGISH